MVLTRPVEMHTTLFAKNAYALVHVRICNGAEASLPSIFLETCASIVQAVVCRSLLPPLLLSRPNPSPDAVRSRNPSKSTIAHDAVAAAVSHKHNSIIRVGAGLINFVYGSHSLLATELILQRILFWPWFLQAFLLSVFMNAALWLFSKKKREKQTPYFKSRDYPLLIKAQMS